MVRILSLAPIFSQAQNPESVRSLIRFFFRYDLVRCGGTDDLFISQILAGNGANRDGYPPAVVHPSKFFRGHEYASCSVAKPYGRSALDS